jgi:hypothetical protein
LPKCWQYGKEARQQQGNTHCRNHGNAASQQYGKGNPMSKRPSLAETMRQAAATSPTSPPMLPVPEVPKAAPTASEPVPARPPGFYAATRAGKKKVTAALDPAAHKQLKSLAVERETTTEALMTEAIRDLLAKYGKPSRA